MGGQIATFFVGQCGTQMGNSCWELYCLEHCISPDGTAVEDMELDNCSYESFFIETDGGHFIPRTIYIDLEPTVLDDVRIGAYRNLFAPDWLVNGNEDAANNFARGFYCCNKTVVRNVVTATRKMIEACDILDAFMVHHSFCGGTGSGFTSLLLDYLSAEYGKRNQVEFGVFPSPSMSTSIVEPYNTVLSMHTPMESVDLAAFLENESLYRICSKKLNVECPMFSNINSIAAQVISGMTCSMRFEGPMNVNIVDYQTNLVPYPRIHFPMVTFSPFLPTGMDSAFSNSTKQITIAAYTKECQLVDVDPIKGVYMSSCMMYRGHVNCREANDAIQFLKACETMKWVDWCPTGYKVGINYQPMLAIPGRGIGYSSRSATILSNSSSVKQVINRINCKFMLLYSRHSFVHWYVAEGMEEDEFKEAFEDVLTLEKDFDLLDESMPKDAEKSNSNEQRNTSQTLAKTRKNTSTNKTQPDHSENPNYLCSTFGRISRKPFLPGDNQSMSEKRSSESLLIQKSILAHTNVSLLCNSSQQKISNSNLLKTPYHNHTKSESNILESLRKTFRKSGIIEGDNFNKIETSEVLLPVNPWYEKARSLTNQNSEDHDYLKVDKSFLYYLLNELDQQPLSQMQKKTSAFTFASSNQNLSNGSGWRSYSNLPAHDSTTGQNSAKVSKRIPQTILANQYLL